MLSVLACYLVVHLAWRRVVEVNVICLLLRIIDSRSVVVVLTKRKDKSVSSLSMTNSLAHTVEVQNITTKGTVMFVGNGISGLDLVVDAFWVWSVAHR